MSPIRICSWNINGLRSIQQPLKCVLDSLSSDIICLQETKSTPDISSEFVLSDNYNAYFSHSLHKPGYSGVAIFCRNPIKPVKTYHSLNEMIIEITSPGSDGCELTNGWDFLMRELNISHTEARNLDAEGRILALQFPADIFDVVGSDSKRCLPLVVMSIYFPRLNSEDVNRLNFKHNFQHAVKLCTELFLLENFVVMAGDFNICHKVIDHCAPDEFEAEKISNPFRQWFDQLLVEQQRDQSLNTEEYSQSRRFVDIFRLLHPNQKNAFTCWSSRTNARQTNYGVRLDYILVDSQLANLYALPNDEIKADLMPDICGSDHCPIYADLPYSYNSNAKLSYSFPPKCSHHWPQCQTKQTQIKKFLVSKISNTKNENIPPILNTSVSCLERSRAKRKTSTLKQAKFTSVGPFKAVKLSESSGSEVQPSSAKEMITPRIKDYDPIKAVQSTEAWWNLLSGPKKPPLCLVHKEPCIVRTVKQMQTSKGNRFGKRFWVCARPQGAPDNPAARCNTFFWDDQVPNNTNK